MKSATSTPIDSSASRRAQPVRQARQKPPRASASHVRPLAGASSGLRNGQLASQSIDIFPAITSFADAISALPRDLVRHFTLLKEVDAKIFHPEEHLHKLVDAALNTPLPDIILQQQQAPLQSLSQTAQGAASVNGSIVNDHTESIATSVEPDAMTAAIYHHSNMPRRQLFRQCTLTMSEMLVSLDEKNHVLSTANDALNKQLRRMDDLYPHIENELTDEAKYGSMTHWAYLDNRSMKAADRARRDAPVISKEAQQQADEAAARSDARKQAMLAKKARANQVESDFDESLAKKPHGNTKKGRPAEVISASGLGISGDGSAAPTAKRRKVEKGPTGGAAMERSNSAMSATNGTAKAKYGSPRELPLPEVKKRTTKATGATAPTKKRYELKLSKYHVGETKKIRATNASANPRVAPASSPVQPTFADAKTAAKASPLVPNGRPVGRGRQNSTQSVMTSASSTSRAKAPMDGPTQQIVTGQINNTTNPAVTSSTNARSTIEAKTTSKELVNNSNVEHMEDDLDQDNPKQKNIHTTNKKESQIKHEEAVPTRDEESPSLSHLPTTKAARLGKTPTPLPTTNDSTPRSRSARAVPDPSTNAKRSHKKGAGNATTTTSSTASNEVNGSGGDVADDDENGDADEPTYCYCNNISYGEMVACDNDACAKEWFHLECAGLDKAPVGKGEFQSLSYNRRP